ncbi:MAG TPA: hypothetical protein VMW85_08365 [Methanomassiliicoccales archaeon]|nr:hypothetical protein [Methanomassiliicoccales archaeon]
MGVRYGVFNHSKKEYVLPENIPVDAADPTTHPYAAFIVNLMLYSWRFDDVVLIDDSRDFDCQVMFGHKYRDRSVELWNEFVLLYGGLFKDLKSV